MKSIILCFLIIGLIMMAIGYQKKIMANMAESKTVVEYRFIPRNIYDEQFFGEQPETTYADMFSKQDIFFKRI